MKVAQTITLGEPLIDLVKLSYNAKVALLLEGPHGIGKSEVVEEAGRRMGIETRTIDLSLCEPMDLVGLPQFANGRTRFAPPTLLPSSGAGLLILEELNRAPSHVRRPCLQLVSARALNEYRLPDGWQIVACTNPSHEDDHDAQYDVDELDPALVSRFLEVRVAPGIAEWLAWASKQQVHAAVVDFIRRSGVQALTTGGAQPRGWVMVSRLVQEWERGDRADHALLCAAVIGAIHDEVWGVGFLRTYLDNEKPLTPQQVLKGDASDLALAARWRKERRVDLLRGSWEATQRHLQTAAVAQKVAFDEQQRGALGAFVGLLPKDVEHEAREWLGKHFRAFGGEPLDRATNRRKRGS